MVLLGFFFLKKYYFILYLTFMAAGSLTDQRAQIIYARSGLRSRQRQDFAHHHQAQTVSWVRVPNLALGMKIAT
jgi:uncharacterized protein (DUF924 family)